MEAGSIHLVETIELNLNTLHHIAFDAKFIHETKKDFLKNELYDRIVGTEYDFMKGDI